MALLARYLPILLLATSTQAQAQDVFSAPRENADRLCASYGPNFVAGQQPGSCVKVQQRLRVDPHARRPASVSLPPAEFQPMQAPAPRPQLRLHGSFGTPPEQP